MWKQRKTADFISMEKKNLNIYVMTQENAHTHIFIIWLGLFHCEPFSFFVYLKIRQQNTEREQYAQCQPCRSNELFR